ncbi:MAG: hypothetical protein OXC55_06065, partial [Chloroflexi bacterium]|nr:hypothetical protein [Chloroflexota bacterium]
KDGQASGREEGAWEAEVRAPVAVARLVAGPLLVWAEKVSYDCDLLAVASVTPLAQFLQQGGKAVD